MDSPANICLIRLKIDRNLPSALYVQIADGIIAAIKNGSLPPGMHLPATRQLAAALKINRNTAVRAYEILSAEGWICASERSATTVSEILPLTRPEVIRPASASASGEISPSPRIFFDDGIPDITCSPINELSRSYRRIFRQKAKWQIMNLSNKLGDLLFREALSRMLNLNRQMTTCASQLCVTRGSQMALFLTARCLLRSGDAVIVENPGFRPAWETFLHAGAKILPVDVGADGIDVDRVEQLLKTEPVRAICLTPHHQYPTTVTLSLSKRLRLIELSNRTGVTIIEDDYDNEFHFGIRPVMPLAAYDEVRNYVYIGTFSKLIAPAIRVGYIYSSPAFIDMVGNLRKIIDGQGDNFMEQALLDLIVSGELRRHQKRMVEIYRKKRDFFASMLEKYLCGKVSYTIPSGGIAFWLTPADPLTDLYMLRDRANKLSVNFYTPDRFSYSKPVCGIRLGYASLSEADIEAGLAVLGRLL